VDALTHVGNDNCIRPATSTVQLHGVKTVLMALIIASRPLMLDERMPNPTVTAQQIQSQVAHRTSVNVQKITAQQQIKRRHASCLWRFVAGRSQCFVQFGHQQVESNGL